MVINSNQLVLSQQRKTRQRYQREGAGKAVSDGSLPRCSLQPQPCTQPCVTCTKHQVTQLARAKILAEERMLRSLETYAQVAGELDSSGG